MLHSLIKYGIIITEVKEREETKMMYSVDFENKRKAALEAMAALNAALANAAAVVGNFDAENVDVYLDSITRAAAMMSGVTGCIKTADPADDED